MSGQQSTTLVMSGLGRQHFSLSLSRTCSVLSVATQPQVGQKIIAAADPSVHTSQRTLSEKETNGEQASQTGEVNLKKERERLSIL